jgi:hypothetical protein
LYHYNNKQEHLLNITVYGKHLFQNLSELLTDGCLKLVAKKSQGEIIIVSVLPTNDKVGDNAKNAITPLVFKDTGDSGRLHHAIL